MMDRVRYSFPVLLLTATVLGFSPGQARALDWGWLWSGKEKPAMAQVQSPFVEWRTGPGSAYPVFNVTEQGQWLELVSRRAGWVKVRDDRGREGWVAVADLEMTRDSAGEPVAITAPDRTAFEARRWEAGVMFGEFDGAAVNSVYGGYWMTENLALEIHGAQVLGDASEILMGTVNLVHQPFPHWRLSPFFTLGAGQVFIDPDATLSSPGSRNDPTANAGLGLRFYVTGRYFLRAEVREHTIFTDRETNEEATEWKIGLSVFF